MREPQAHHLPTGTKRMRDVRDIVIRKSYHDYSLSSKRMRVSFTLPEADIELKPLVITEGPLKGKTVILLEPLTFKLMELPPEVRLMIFSKLLVQKNKIVVGSKKGKLANGAYRIGSSHNYRERMTGAGRLPGFNLLLVSKTIRQEAAEIAYGHNAFEIRSLSAADGFITGIGEMAHFLKHISLPDVNPMSAVGANVAKRYIRLPRQIESIHFSWVRIFRNVSTLDFEQAIHRVSTNTVGHLSFALRWKARTVDKDVVESLIKIVPHKGKMCRRCKDKCDSARMLQDNAWECRLCQAHYDQCQQIEAAIKRMINAEL